MVPLTQGVQPTIAWPLQAAGSAVSMTNFLPFDGVLIPRSRLSSLHTNRPAGFSSAHGMHEMHSATFNIEPRIWWSDATLHGLLSSSGSISVGSFVSAGGLGVSGLPSMTQWQYVTAFSGIINENMTLAVGKDSLNTVLALYQTSGSATGLPLYSYLTGAPKANCLGAFDNYVIAFRTSGGPTRVQWCVRGEPTNWSGEGSGFEDLLEMRGYGTAVKGLGDRLVLFSSAEIWYGLRATYPAQFQFYPLDRTVGCPFPRTIQETEHGLVFLGSDHQMRLIPVAGGPSQPIAPGLAPVLRRLELSATHQQDWGVYDPYTKLYYLFVDRSITGNAPFQSLVVNTQTGEWGFNNMEAIDPYTGISHALEKTTHAASEGVFLATSTGTFYSLNSLLATDSGSTVTATYRSGPIATDLPANWKQVTAVELDYRATSASTVTLKISQDGNTYETTGRAVSLPSATVAGRAQAQMYLGGAFPSLEIASTSTGFELHRIDATLNIGGRR